MKIVIVSLVGFFVGILMLVAGLNTEAIPVLRKIFDIIHKPASWLAYFWSYKLHLPPQNEAAFAVVPLVAVVLQWTLLGIIVGLLKK